MAPNKSAAQLAKEAAAAAEVAAKAAAEVEANWSWDAMEDDVVMADKVIILNVTANILETVPEPIRKRAEVSLAENTKAVAAKANSNASRPRVDYVWRLARVPSEAKGNEFVKMLYKYAKYRPSDKAIPFADEASPNGQVTARPQAPQYYKSADDGEFAKCAAEDDGAFLAVRYSVRPREQKTDAERLPGTA